MFLKSVGILKKAIPQKRLYNIGTPQKEKVSKISNYLSNTNDIIFIALCSFLIYATYETSKWRKERHEIKMKIFALKKKSQEIKIEDFTLIHELIKNLKSKLK
jgi:hypothetical protein